MWTKQRKNTNRHRLIVPALAVVFLSYFGFHAIHGHYGLQSRMELEARADALQQELAALVKKRKSLEQQVQLLHDDTLERDMLDERARAALNLARPDEIVILRDAGW